MPAPLSAEATVKTVASAIWTDHFYFYICPPNSGGFSGGGWKVRSFLVVHANVAQLVEQLICNQQVGGSNPPVGSVNGTRGDTQVANGGRL